MKRYFKYILAFGAIVPLFFSQLGSSIQHVKASEEDNTIVISLPLKSEPESGFDPIVGWGRHGIQIFHTGLLKRDSNLEVQNDLAKNYEISENGLTWTFNLREDVVFSDGEEFDSEDVVFTFTKAMESDSIVDLTNLESVEAVDKYIVEFTLTNRNSTFVDSIVSTGIVPAHAYDENYAQNPIGTGPLEIVEYQDGEQLITKPNENYYGENVPFDQVTFVWMNEDASLAAAQAGSLDIAYVPLTLADSTIDGMELHSIPSVENRGIAYVMTPDQGETTEEGYKIGNDVTSDYSIRYAIDKALDRDMMIEGLAQGHGTVATSVADGLPWWNEELANLPDEYGHMDAAIEELEENGWVDSNGDGIREKEGLEARFDLIYLAEDSERQGIAINVADQLSPLGIQVTPVGLSWDQTIELMHSTPVVMGWGSYNPLETYYLYHSDYRGVEYYNTGFYSNAQVDDYLDAAIDSINQEEAMENWKKAHWDGETGFSSYGDIAWSWLYNANHLYYINDQLDIGETIIQPHHGRGWALVYNLSDWTWKE